MKGSLFAELDRADFVAAFGDKLRSRGLGTPLSSLERYSRGLEVAGQLSKSRMYWLTRISLLQRIEDLVVFDAVYEAVFDFELNRNRPPRRETSSSSKVKSSGNVLHRLPVTAQGDPVTADGLAWATMPEVSEAEDDHDDDEEPQDRSVLPELAPSATVAIEDKAFEDLTTEELARMCLQLEEGTWSWPARRSRRHRQSSRAGPIAMRATLRQAARTGGEAASLINTQPRFSDRRVIMILDVSGSMESYVRAYLHTCRTLVGTGKVEVFAVGTDIHRLTPALRHRSAAQAMALASEAVGDPLGGTRLSSSIGTLLRHKTWGNVVRGSVVVIASDGWDSDPPEQMGVEMERLSRRAHSVVWMNPRSAAIGYEPLVGSMAAALPYCDHFLSGHSANAMLDVMEAIQTS